MNCETLSTCVTNVRICINYTGYSCLRKNAILRLRVTPSPVQEDLEIVEKLSGRMVEHWARNPKTRVKIPVMGGVCALHINLSSKQKQAPL